MNHSYYNKSNSSQTPGKTRSTHVTQIQLNISKMAKDRDLTDQKRGDSLLNMLLLQQQQAIQSARQLSIERPLKTSPIESSPHIQKKTISASQQLFQGRKSTEQYRNNTQFDRLLNENASLLVRIQQLEKKNQLLQMQCVCRKKNQENVQKPQTDDSSHQNENENRILRELINRQPSIMHIPSVIQTLSLIK